MKQRSALGKRSSYSSNTSMLFWEYHTAQRACLLVQHFTIAAFSTVRTTYAVPLRSCAFLAFHHSIRVVSLAGIQTNLRAGALNAQTNSSFLSETLAWNLSFLPDVHTEAVQAALAKHKERKMAVPMPSKRRSLVVQTSMDAYTPPGEHLCVFYKNFKNGSLCC